MRRAIALLWLIAVVLPLFAAELPKGLMALDGRPAPELRLADMDGRITDIGTLRGRWLMVHFWAGWCGPCRRELPTLERMTHALGDAGPVLVLVNTAETEDDVFAFLSGVTPDLATLLDRDGQVTERWQPRGLPATFFVDPEGRLRYLALGGRSWDTPEYLAFIRGLIRSRASR
jgi:cytochrome c biogenesis protein CcmG, thiol:disulfide interchange protein DsbE